jgi:hypothetical protein
MENPYQSPTPNRFSDAAAPTAYQPPGSHVARGMVGHVRVLGILMIVQGVLDLLMGLMLVAMGIGLPFLMSMDGNARNPPPAEMPWIFGLVYGGMGLCGVIPGILHVWAGWRVFHFQQRTFGIVSISAGALSLGTCYCGFTAIGLLVYGLIVLLDASVKQAFDLAQQGYTPDQIDATFNPWLAAQGVMQPPPVPPPK